VTIRPQAQAPARLPPLAFGARGMPRALLAIPLAFVALAAASPAGAEPVFVVSGHGWGHGVGLSQWGARGYAERGWRYDRILAHYYPGTRLGPARMARVRVLLASSRTRVRVGSRRAFLLSDATGRRWVVPAGGLILGPGLRTRIRGKVVRLRSPVRAEGGGMPIRWDRRPYRGALVIRSRAGLMSVVNDVGLERYLRGVVPWEMPHRWHGEALRAQAVIARSYALATLKPGKIYDLVADTRSQVYGGIGAEEARTNRAIGSTAGQVLLWNGRVATTFYHSTSGGRTAAVWDVWPGARRVPYLRGVVSPYETASPHYEWGPVQVSPAELARLLRRPGLREARDLTVRRNSSLRPTLLLAWTPAGAKGVAPDALRRSLDLRSAWVDVGVLALSKPREPATWGRPLVLGGIARGFAGALVQRLDGSRWRTVAVAKKRRDGRFLARVRPLESGLYRVAGAGIAAPGVRVEVAPRVEARAVEGAVLGRVRPVQAAPRVALQRLAGDDWITFARVPLDAAGDFRLDGELEPGSYRAAVAPAGELVAGASEPFRIGGP
jgi:stage II sporulation protein D